MVMSYDSLVEQIQNYVYRTDEQFLAAIPVFIQNAHSRIYRDAKDLGEQKYFRDSFIDGSPIVTKPADWWQTISFSYGTAANVFTAYQILLPRTYEFCRIYWPNVTLTNPPLYYSDYPSLDPNATPIQSYTSFYITPTPNDLYEFQLVYLTQPIVITNDIQTNWLTQYAPDLLFYACLVDATPYLQDDARSATWGPMYKESLQSVNNYTKGRYVDRIYQRDKV